MKPKKKSLISFTPIKKKDATPTIPWEQSGGRKGRCETQGTTSRFETVILNNVHFLIYGNASEGLFPLVGSNIKNMSVGNSTK